MSIEIRTAPDSWGVWTASDLDQVPWRRLLDELVEAGYEWFELGPYGSLHTELPMRRHHDRISHLHLKNVDKAIQLKVELKRIPFGKAIGTGVSCDLRKAW